MVRRAGYEPDDPDSLAVAKLKDALKTASPETRSHVMRWLAKYYNDAGDLFSPSLQSHQRQRITLNGEAYWLVRAPGK